MLDNRPSSYPYQNNNGPAADAHTPPNPAAQPQAAETPAPAAHSEPGALVGWQRISTQPQAPDIPAQPAAGSTPNPAGPGDPPAPAGSTPNWNSTPSSTAGGTPTPSVPGGPGTSYGTPVSGSSWVRSANAPYGAPPAPPARKSKDKQKGRGAGFVAAMLAVSLVGGAAGGGATYLALSSGGVQEQAVVSTVDPGPGDAAPASTNTNSPLTAGSLESSESYSIIQVVEKASPSVVEISTEIMGTSFFGNYASSASGSGVILTQDGFIVTNDHVVEDAQAIMVRTEDGQEYEAVLVGTDPKTDLAVLKIDASGLTPVAFADSDQVQVGETAIAIGNPLGTLGGTVTDGIISAINREVVIGKETMTLLQTSAAVNPGNSGGGLFNARGELVGIVNAKSYGEEIEGLGFAIPSNTVAQVVEDMIEYGYVTGRPQLGISIVEINNPQAAMYYGVDTYGVYIAETTRENGLLPGDRVLSINGQEIESAEDITGFVEEAQVGDLLSFRLVRDGQEITVEVDLVEKVPEYVQQAVSSEDL